jgi:hypothetical protein
MKIKDLFEIKEEYKTGHEPGLVIVLDTLIPQDPTDLVGRIAEIQIPTKGNIRLPIQEVQHHGTATSLFFPGLARENIPLGSEIVIAPRPAFESTKSSRSIAS